MPDSLPEFCVYLTNDQQSPWKGRLESALRGVPLRQSQCLEDALTQAAGVVFLDQSVEASVLEALSMLSASPMHPPVVFLGSQEEIPENMRAIFASTALSESDTDDRVEEAVRRAMIEQAGKLSQLEEELFQSISDSALLVTPSVPEDREFSDFTILRVNPTAARTLGREEGSLVGLSMRAELSGMLDNEMMQVIGAAPSESAFVDGHGQKYHLRATLFGRRILIQIKDLDTTDRVRGPVEEERDLYLDTLEKQHWMVFRCKRNDQGQFVLYLGRGQMLERFGLSPASFDGRTLQEILPIDVAANYHENLERAWQGQDVTFINSPTESGQHYLISLRPIGNNERHVVDVVGSVVDITTEVQLRGRLNENNERYRAVFQNTQEGIVVADTKGQIERANASITRIFGYPVEELIGKNVRMLCPEEMQAEHDDYMRRYLETGIAKIIGKGREVEGRRKDGSLIHLFLRISTSWSDGGMKFVAFLEDREEREELERALRQAQKMEALGTLSASIAHDFNNIIAPISAQAELAKRNNPDNDRLIDRMDKILRSSQRAKDLVKRVMHFSRESELEVSLCDPAELVEEAVEMIRAVAPPAVNIDLVISAELPSIMADFGQLNQVLLNLMTNAMHAMEEKGGTLTVKALAAGQEESVSDITARFSNSIVISVEDTGVGIPEHIQERIFDPFFTTKGKGKGTGLGLATALKIVEDHGGSIHVRSKIGEGTRFELTLPGARPGTPSSTSIHRPSPATSKSFRKGSHCILFIDDQADLCSSYAEMAEELGYAGEWRISAAEVLKEIEGGACFDVIISDQDMPDFSGALFVRTLRERNIRTPVIMCTALKRSDEIRALPPGYVTALMRKPITIRQLELALRHALGSK